MLTWFLHINSEYSESIDQYLIIQNQVFSPQKYRKNWISFLMLSLPVFSSILGWVVFLWGLSLSLIDVVSMFLNKTRSVYDVIRDVVLVHLDVQTYIAFFIQDDLVDIWRWFLTLSESDVYFWGRE